MKCGLAATRRLTGIIEMRWKEIRVDPSKWLIGRVKVPSDNDRIHFAALLNSILCLENELQTVTNYETLLFYVSASLKLVTREFINVLCI